MADREMSRLPAAIEAGPSEKGNYRLLKLKEDNYLIWRYAFENIAIMDGLEHLFDEDGVLSTV